MRRVKKGDFGWRIVRSAAGLGLLVISLILMVIFLRRDEVFRLWSEATGQAANITVQAQLPGRPLARIWAHLAQGGEDLSTDMLAPIVTQVKSLTPETIRIDHIYDGYGVVSRNDDGQLTFNWTRLDGIVNSIRKTGAIPMLSLSYMPPAISRGDMVDLPRDWNEWGLVVQKTIEHYSGELGIPDVAYEVWNEPDLFGGWKTYGQKSYLELYRLAVMGAGRANNVQPFKIGGPAITAPYPAWIDKFLDFVSRERLRIDFLSWHRYSISPQKYSEDIEQVDKIVQQYSPLVGGIDLYITETGPDSENNSAYDAGAGAAHLVSMVRETAGKVKRVYIFEIVDGKDPNGQVYWGRWGILTNPAAGNQIKPRYRAVEFLNRLEGGQLPVSGEGSWVKGLATKNPGGTIQLVLVNYDQYGRHNEETPVAVTGLTPGGEYSIFRTLLGGFATSEKVIADAAGTVRTIPPLPANSVMLLEITPAVTPR